LRQPEPDDATKHLAELGAKVYLKGLLGQAHELCGSPALRC
jgi:hypothetical protein